jgi:hypothetical protein
VLLLDAADDDDAERRYRIGRLGRRTLVAVHRLAEGKYYDLVGEALARFRVDLGPLGAAGRRTEEELKKTNTCCCC